MIEGYIRGELSGRDLDRLEEHLLTCEGCHEKLEELSFLRAALEESEADNSVKERPPRWTTWRWVGLAAAAVLVLVVLMWPSLTGPPASGVAPLAQLAKVEPPRYIPKSLRSAESEAELRYREAMAEYQKGRFAEAIPGLEAALDLDPELTPARFFLGATYLMEGEAGRAIDSFTQVLESGDSDYREQALWLQGKTFLKVGDIDSARRDLEKVVLMDGALASQAREVVDQLPD